jgi:hypothetical protein
MRTISWTALSDKGIIRLNFTPITLSQLACIVQILLILECLIVFGKILIAISGHDLYYLI